MDRNWRVVITVANTCSSSSRGQTGTSDASLHGRGSRFLAPPQGACMHALTDPRHPPPAIAQN